MNDPIIITRNLSHIYQPGPLQHQALLDVSLEIRRGSCTAIVGVTGSGKSTLVQHFNALLRPTAGDVIVDGIDAGRTADVRSLRRRVGMLFQSPEMQLFAPTVAADVAFGPRRLGLPAEEVHQRVSAALDIVGLPAARYGQRSPFALSGGQMRRIALAGVLASDPAVLVLDEPSVGLDAAGRDEIYSIVRRVQRQEGVTVVLVSHDMAEVAALADQVMVLHAGRLVEAGPPHSIFARAERLPAWGLLAPPLSELLALVRQGGVDVPASVATLEQAFAAISSLRAGKDSTK
ncbi:MAG TPA: energy-coupling factor transporter ATPase [Roseiflexaceae bacterium]|nr:energy-coupling factor transporter ATPase [Roseiflexaceae bacterium]